MTAPAETDSTGAYARLLRQSIVALAVAAGLVVLGYFFVDRQVAWFVYDHRIYHINVLRWLTLPEPIAQTWSPLALALLACRRARGPLYRCEVTLFAACVALIIADQFRESLQTPFSRLWPDTWIDNNPSLIRNDEFGFFPFHGGAGYASFPSGHTARALAALAVLWIAYPRLRWISVTLAAIFGGSLIGMNYHFVSDVIAGGFLGAIVGAWTARLCSLRAAPADARLPPAGPLQ